MCKQCSVLCALDRSVCSVVTVNAAKFADVKLNFRVDEEAFVRRRVVEKATQQRFVRVFKMLLVATHVAGGGLKETQRAHGSHQQNPQRNRHPGCSSNDLRTDRRVGDDDPSEDGGSNRWPNSPL